MDGEDMENSTQQSKNNVSKFLIDLNKRELEKFFNLEKKTKVALSVTALALLLFVSVGFFSPFKNRIFEAIYPKSPSSAQEKNELTKYKSDTFGFEFSYPKMSYILTEYNPKGEKTPTSYIAKEGARSRFAAYFCPAEQKGCPESTPIFAVEVYENKANWTPKQWLTQTQYPFINQTCELTKNLKSQTQSQFLGKDAQILDTNCDTKATVFKNGQKIYILGQINLSNQGQAEEINAILNSFRLTQ